MSKQTGHRLCWISIKKRPYNYLEIRLKLVIGYINFKFTIWSESKYKSMLRKCFPCWLISQSKVQLTKVKSFEIVWLYINVAHRKNKLSIIISKQTNRVNSSLLTMNKRSSVTNYKVIMKCFIFILVNDKELNQMKHIK